MGFNKLFAMDLYYCAIVLYKETLFQYFLKVAINQIYLKR